MKITDKATTRSPMIAGISTTIFFLAVATGVRGFAAKDVLSVNDSTYTVGERTTYVIKGAPPRREILWSSWKDGVFTGEQDANYGHQTDAQGNWSATAGPWSENTIGLWKKQARLGG